MTRAVEGRLRRALDTAGLAPDLLCPLRWLLDDWNGEVRLGVGDSQGTTRSIRESLVRVRRLAEAGGKGSSDLPTALRELVQSLGRDPAPPCTTPCTYMGK